MLVRKVGCRVYASQHLEDAKSVERAVCVPDGIQYLRGTFPGRGTTLFGGDTGAEFAFQRAHVAGTDQLITGPDAEVQISGRLFLECDVEVLGSLLRSHGIYPRYSA